MRDFSIFQIVMIVILAISSIGEITKIQPQIKLLSNIFRIKNLFIYTGLIIIISYPNLMNNLNTFMGVPDNMSFIIYVCIAYLLFKINKQNEHILKLRGDLDELVRKLALNKNDPV